MFMNNTITNDTTLDLELDSEKLPSESRTELVPVEVLPAEPFAREAEWVRREHKVLSHASLVTIARNAAVGEVLTRIQAALGHGKWGAWTKRNLPGISDRTIRRYMEIFRRYREPLAYEDPEAFLAQIYGNVELPPSERRTTTPPPQLNRTLTSDLTPDGKKSPPSKRTRKSAKAKAPPPTDDDAPPPTPLSVETLSPELLLDNAAESLEEMVEDWKRRSLEPLMENTGLSARIAAGLETIDEDLDGFVAGIVERLREYSRSLAS
jgi:hypothetical protein